MLFKGSKGQADLVSLFDREHLYSAIRTDIAENLGNPELLPDVYRFYSPFDGHEILVKHRIALTFYVNGVRLSDEFNVIPTLTEEAIIGITTIQKWRIKLDTENGSVLVDPKLAMPILKSPRLRKSVQSPISKV